MKSAILSIFRKKIPEERRLRLRKQLLRLYHPAFLGTLRRTTPLSYQWGTERGQPVDRYYIEQFLENYSNDIRGHVLEIKDSGYTNRFGSAVLKRDVLDIDATNSQATFIADLARADALPSDNFDCFIITQTLQFIFELQAAISHCYRILRPGGVLLLTVPCISRIDRALAGTDYWRFTTASCSALFGEFFGLENITVQGRGNVLTDMAFLTGMAGEELSKRELETHDDYFPLIITVRAVKAKV